MGDLGLLEHDISGAEGWYRRAVEGDPSYVDALSYLGRVARL